MKTIKAILIPCLIILCSFQPEKDKSLKSRVIELCEKTETQVIEWRHYFHQYPELSNREFKTSEKIAGILSGLGLEVQTEIAHTGVVGLLRGGKPGPVVALRADMDGLPVTETSDLPYKSLQRAEYAGQEVGVMHACGHDTHISMLLGVATVLSKIKDELPGTVKFIFQPAEEGAPLDEEGGAGLMVKEGVLKDPDVDAIFGLHIWSNLPVGKIMYKPEGTMASANAFTIRVHGSQTHGGRPWDGVDPIVASAQIINNIQAIVSRNMELTEGAAVISVGSIHGGLRNNIIPNEVEMEGTIRAVNESMKQQLFRRLNEVVVNTAKSNGTTAELVIHEGNPVTYNNPELTAKMIPTLKDVVGEENLILGKVMTVAEDFSHYQKEIPGLFLHLGGMSPNQDPATAPAHHTPGFYVDDSAMITGMKTLSRLTLDYLLDPGK